jgi:hypothetical protein
MNLAKRLAAIGALLMIALLVTSGPSQAVECTFGSQLEITTDQNGCCRVSIPIKSDGCGPVMVTYEYSPCDENGYPGNWYSLGSATYPGPTIAVETICDFEYCSGYGHHLRLTMTCASCNCSLACQVETDINCVNCGHCD